MDLKPIPHSFSVCKVTSAADVDLTAPFCFVGKTDEELSLVCPTQYAPAACPEREDGWRAFRIQGVLDFSLVGILADISATLARSGIGLFAVSTYNTDYILVREDQFQPALEALARAGHRILD